MTDKQLFKLALDALELYGNRHRATYLLDGAWDEEITVGDQAIAALKEALAQPEQTEVQQLIALVRAQQITIDKLEMALVDPMRETQRLGQEIEQDADSFCDSNCVWTDHHPDCKLAQRTWVDLTNKEVDTIRANALTKEWAILMAQSTLKEKNT